MWIKEKVRGKFIWVEPVDGSRGLITRTEYKERKMGIVSIKVLMLRKS